MWATYKLDTDGTTGAVPGQWTGGDFNGRLGPIPYELGHYQGGKITVTVFAQDEEGLIGSASVIVGLDACKLG
jgi:hypothetical protein